MESIGQSALNQCSSLTSIEIPEGVTTLGDAVFWYCNSLTTMSLPASLTSIKNETIEYCPALTTITVAVGSTTFESEDGVLFNKGKTTLIKYPEHKGGTSYTVPSSVTTIDYRAFEKCTNLTSITLSENLEATGIYAFYNCTGLTSINIPASLRTIGNGSFWDCTNLTTVCFAEGSALETIGRYAFDTTGLTSISIPDGVTSIGNGAFSSCSGLRSVTLYAPSCALGGEEDEYSHNKHTSAFNGTHSSLKIYVFNEYVNTYKTADFWSTYASKIAAITIPARESSSGEYWTTYYNNFSNALAPEGTQVFKVALSGSHLTLTEIPDRIITKGEGVVLKTTSGSILPEYSTSASATSYSDKDLDGTMTSITNPGDAFVLNYKIATGVGFYKLSAGGTIGANKAYLTYSGLLGAREFFAFEEETTGIDSTVVNSEQRIDNNVYDLQGRRVEQPTRGLYIVNGKKVVIK